MITRPRTIYIVALVGVVLYGFPGLVSYDSIVQLDEARRWELGNWHPAVMSALWRVVELVVTGTFGMLLLQAAALIAGLGGILRTQLAPRRAALVALAIAWFPPVLVVMGVIWKDAQMAGYLALAIALCAGPPGRRRWIGIALFVLASALRHNAPAATLVPIVLLVARERVRWQRWLVGIAAWLAITLAGIGLDAALTNHPGPDLGDLIEVTDIQGIARWAGPLSDDELRPLLAGANLHVDRDIQRELAAHYDPRNYLEFSEHPQPLEVSQTPAQRDAIGHAWRTLVLREPAAYVHHRWQLFRQVLELHAPSRPPAIVTTDDLYSRSTASAIQRAWFWLVRAISPLWYVPFIYFAVGIALLALARTRLEVALLGSGLVYELSLFAGAMTGDYRYSHWLIVTVVLAAVLIAHRRYMVVNLNDTGKSELPARSVIEADNVTVMAVAAGSDAVGVNV